MADKLTFKKCNNRLSYDLLHPLSNVPWKSLTGYLRATSYALGSGRFNVGFEMWTSTKDTWEIRTSSTVVREFGSVTSLAGVGDLGVRASMADVGDLGISVSLEDV